MSFTIMHTVELKTDEENKESVIDQSKKRNTYMFWNTCYS